MDDGARALQEQLGAPPPPGLGAAAGDDALQRLADEIAETRHAQRRAMAAAGEAGLRHVPALLRGPVKKIVGL